MYGIAPLSTSDSSPCCLPSPSPSPSPLSPTSASQPRRYGFQSIPEITQLSPYVIRVCGLNPSPFCLRGTNIYIIGDGADRFIIDAGSKFSPDIGQYSTKFDPNCPRFSSDRVTENIRNALRSSGATRISSIFVTHYHLDHTGGLDSLLAMAENFNETNEKIPVWKFDLTMRGDVSDQFEYSEILPACNQTWKILCKNGEEISLKPFKGPGHTSDSIGFLMNAGVSSLTSLPGDSNCSESPFLNSAEEFSPRRNLRILFCGDTMLGEGTTVYVDAISYTETLRRMRILPIDAIFPGHGPVLNQPQFAIRDYIELIQFKEKKILTIVTEASKPRKNSLPTTSITGNRTTPTASRSSFSFSPTALSNQFAGPAITEPVQSPTNSLSSSSSLENSSSSSPPPLSVPGISLNEILKKFYLRIDPDLAIAAKEMIRLHLIVLEKTGKVKFLLQTNPETGIEEGIFTVT